MKKFLKMIAVGLVTMSLVACSTGGDQTKKESSKDGGYKIAVVPKLTSISWFQRMEVGVNEWNSTNKDKGHDVFYTGPSEGDGALQAQVIEDLIAQDVDAIAVVPFSTEALEPVLKKARDKGIVVITHEAAGMTNIDYDIEAFNNDEYGEHFMKKIIDDGVTEGEYLQLVGSLTTASHNQWIDAAQKYQEDNAPGLKPFGDKIETADSQDQSYQRVKEALTANKNIVAVQGSAMGDVAGAALAVKELGLTGKVKIVGTSLVSVSGNYVKDDVIDMVSFWDPALAGQAMVELAIKVLDGDKIESGLDLGIEGYDKLQLDGNVLLGQAWIDITKDNVTNPDYDF